MNFTPLPFFGSHISIAFPKNSFLKSAWNGLYESWSPLSTPAISAGPSTLKRIRLSASGQSVLLASSASTRT
jgi:hypothetical protein